MIFRNTLLAMGFSIASTALYAGGLNQPESAPAVINVPPPVVSHSTVSWDGFYGGLSFNSVSGGLNENTGGGMIFDLDRDTALGAFLGYNWQRGNFVYGGELNYTAVDTAFVGAPLASQEDVIELRARGGYTIGRVLLYGFLGYANSSLDDTGLLFDQDGISYGLGADYLITDRIFAGLELGRRDVDGEVFGVTLGTDIDTIGLRLGIQF